MSGAFADLRDLYQGVVMGIPAIRGTRSGWTPSTARPKATTRCAVTGSKSGSGCRTARLAEAGFEARGCAIVVASADLMVAAVTGQEPAAIATLAEQFRAMVKTGACPDCGQGLDALKPLSGVHEYPSRLKCATLPWDALESALKEARHG